MVGMCNSKEAFLRNKHFVRVPSRTTVRANVFAKYHFHRRHTSRVHDVSVDRRRPYCESTNNKRITEMLVRLHRTDNPSFTHLE